MVRVKQYLLMIAVATVGLLFCCTARANEKNDYSIVIPENAKSSEVYAAQMLSDYLSAISDTTYPIIKDSSPIEGYGFFIGDTSVWDTSDIQEKTDGSYHLVPFDRGLAIYGAGTRGTLYGVYGFLEDYCGYRCFTAETGMQSVTGKITFPDQKVEYNSFFEYTDTDWKSPHDPEYSLANGLNGGPHRILSEEQGGVVEYIGEFCHTLTTSLCEASRYYDSHPEYYALHDGKRVSDQLCLTNENVYNTVLSEVMALLKKYHDPEAPLQIISLTQNDNMNYCECDNCRALDEHNGSHAGTVITFANKIARAVKKAGYSNVAIDVFAYLYSRKAPSDVIPEDNVIVRFCTIESCFSHPLDECSENREMLEDIKAWNKICDRMYVWDYTTNYAYPIGIFPDFDVLQANMQFFYENDIKGVYEEGNYFLPRCDSEFGELRSYLISRLLRDPYCDYDREMELFCNAYYGKGGNYIKEFISRITECSLQKHVTIYTPMSDSFSISEDEAAEFDKLWESAVEASSGNKRALAAIRRSMLSWRYVKACLGLREFSGSLDDSMNEREKLYNDLISHGIEKIDEWSEIKEDFESYRSIPVEEWAYADYIYFLYYDANGGNGAPPKQWSGEFAMVSPIVPSRKGYIFLGWSPDSSAKTAEYQPEDYFTLTEDMTLYAVWEEEWTPENEEGGTPDENASQEVITYNISVAGTDINSTTAKDLSVIRGVTLKDGGYARYDHEKGILYLKDAIIATPDNPANDSYGLWAVCNENTRLTILVKGRCRITGSSAGQTFPASLGVWGNLTIQLGEKAVLDIKAPSAPKVNENAAMYMGGTLTVDGPGTLNLIGGSADTSEGTSYACYLSGSATFKGGCTVNFCAGTQAAAGKGLCLEGDNLTLKDRSAVYVQGGNAEQSYGLQFLSEGDHKLITEDWTGSLIIEGGTSAILGEKETFTRNTGDTLLFGSNDIESYNMRLLKKGTYTCSDLQQYKQLIFGRSEGR